MTGDREVGDRTHIRFTCEFYFGEIGAAGVLAVDECRNFCADFCREMAAQRRVAFFAKLTGTILRGLTADLFHFRGRRARARRERKNMQEREATVLDKRKRIAEL